MASEQINVVVQLNWDPDKEDPRAALAETFAAMARGIKAGKRKGLLLRGGDWEVRRGAEQWFEPKALPSASARG